MDIVSVGRDLAHHRVLLLRGRHPRRPRRLQTICRTTSPGHETLLARPWFQQQRVRASPVTSLSIGFSVLHLAFFCIRFLISM